MRAQDPNDQAAIEHNLRAMHWKDLVRTLKRLTEAKHEPLELPSSIRTWLEINRDPQTQDEADKTRREAEELKYKMTYDPTFVGWFDGKTETIPISGWIVSATNVLKDGKLWWIFSAKRHDDDAPLIGEVVPAAADRAALRKLGKVISYAGGNVKHEILRTGPITREEFDAFVAQGTPYEYGLIMWWWKA